MLVISRKPRSGNPDPEARLLSMTVLELEEDLPAGTVLRVFVCSVQGPRAKLGIDAPDSVRIDRGEVAARRVLEQQPEPAAA